MTFSSLIVILASACAGRTPFCQGGCKANQVGGLPPHQQVIPVKCFAQPNSGRCYALNRSFFYNPESGNCHESNFGGCDDGCLGFNSKLDCESSCIKFVIQPAEDIPSFKQKACTVSAPSDTLNKYKNLPATCFTSTVTGNCRAKLSSYHFDADLGKCVKNTFGGCQDGCLAFRTEKDCQKSCHA